MIADRACASASKGLWSDYETNKHTLESKVALIDEFICDGISALDLAILQNIGMTAGRPEGRASRDS